MPPHITITRNGPYAVHGRLPLRTELVVCDEKEIPLRWQAGERFPDRDAYTLCRCGRSANRPFCDGTHRQVGFRDIVPASRWRFFDEARLIEGLGIDLYDLPSLCVTGKFCHRAGNVWRLVEHAGDQASVDIVIEDACDCPSGRLVAAKKGTGPIEPEFAPSISLIEMPSMKLSGPLWVKGGIPIRSIDGWDYEVRNRVTLCRCGNSANMPFCDGTHLKIGFNDGTSAVR